jgi:hypothetical protein
LPKTKQRTLAFGKKTSAFLFVFSELFSLPSIQNEEEKNKQTRSKVFFAFCQDNNLIGKTMKHFCVSQLSKQNKHLFKKKKQLFFLA